MHERRHISQVFAVVYLQQSSIFSAFFERHDSGVDCLFYCPSQRSGEGEGGGWGGELRVNVHRNHKAY